MPVLSTSSLNTDTLSPECLKKAAEKFLTEDYAQPQNHMEEQVLNAVRATRSGESTSRMLQQCLSSISLSADEWSRMPVSRVQR